MLEQRPIFSVTKIFDCRKCVATCSSHYLNLVTKSNILINNFYFYTLIFFHLCLFLMLLFNCLKKIVIICTHQKNKNQAGFLGLFFVLNLTLAVVGVDECQVTPVIHVLQFPGCIPKPIPSFACTGRCSSYLQVNKYNQF